MSTLVGTTLHARYRLDELVGTGGMSTVYRAHDLTLERPVAIKLLHREIASDSAQLERFRREARSVAQLSHPHIVGVIDAGEDQGRPYIVFEYIEGETLKERIRRLGRLPVSEAVAYAIEIARALGAAHARHIIHRDVKPQNVLMDSEGSAKVTDFGIARSLDEEGLTADGRVLGTTDYVSPEQALGHPVGVQSDLYSLGIVLWEMLVGSPPFTGDNQVAVAMKHVREQLPDIQVRRPEVSSALAAVIDRATTKHLDRRHQSAAELIEELEDALTIETSRGGATGEATAVLRTLPERRRRRVPLRIRTPSWLLAVAALGLGAAGVAVAIGLASKTHRGTGAPASIPARRGVAPLVGVPLSQGAAHDFDPLGDKVEHPAQTGLAVDNVPGTYWTSESYSTGSLQKAGVGIYLDAAPGLTARALRIVSPTPGFTATVYAAPVGSAPTAAPPRGGWTMLASVVGSASRQTIPFSPASEFQYFLLWITKLPPGQQQVKIDELGLYR